MLKRLISFFKLKRNTSNRKIRVIFYLDSIIAQYLQDFNEDGQSIEKLSGQQLTECYYELEGHQVIIQDKWIQYNDITSELQELCLTYYMKPDSISYFIVTE
ncbi:hypothetical protein ASD24_29725 [Paenibacillus sp. Root52]|nr:hypothetical protein ASD24_29725 [Paenibacillus sp. Root52]